jgi:hypothetical protein
MNDDPRNPNAWWAVKPGWPSMVPRNLTNAQKKRMAWILSFVLVLGSIEIYYVIRLIRMR